MRSHNCQKNYMKLPCIICNVNIDEITNRISVRPIMVRRVSVSSAHLTIIKMNHFLMLQGIFLITHGFLTTVTTNTIIYLYCSHHEKKATKTVFVDSPPLDHTKLGEH